MSLDTRQFYITSLWGRRDLVKPILSDLPRNATVHFAGNYFDYTERPYDMLLSLQALRKQTIPPTKTVHFHRGRHDEALLILTGRQDESAEFRRFWVSPYLGTPYTIAALGVNPWLLYRAQVSTLSRQLNEVLKFLKDTTPLSSTSLDASQIKTILEASYDIDLIRIFEYSGPDLNLVQEISISSSFYWSKLIPWVETELQI